MYKSEQIHTCPASSEMCQCSSNSVIIINKYIEPPAAMAANLHPMAFQLKKLWADRQLGREATSVSYNCVKLLGPLPDVD